MHMNLFLKQLTQLVEDEENIIANLSNTSAFLNDILDDINWVGFYLFDGKELVLGPFQGKIACIRIPLEKGVCGFAAKHKKMIRVDDVHQFEGHIACDSQSRSEIVLPIIVNNELKGVLDIDSPSYKRFTLEDENFLKEIVHIIETKIFM